MQYASKNAFIYGFKVLPVEHIERLIDVLSRTINSPTFRWVNMIQDLPKQATVIQGIQLVWSIQWFRNLCSYNLL